MKILILLFSCQGLSSLSLYTPIYSNSFLSIAAFHFRSISNLLWGLRHFCDNTLRQARHLQSEERPSLMPKDHLRCNELMLLFLRLVFSRDLGSKAILFLLEVFYCMLKDKLCMRDQLNRKKMVVCKELYTDGYIHGKCWTNQVLLRSLWCTKSTITVYFMRKARMIADANRWELTACSECTHTSFLLSSNVHF